MIFAWNPLIIDPGLIIYSRRKKKIQGEMDKMFELNSISENLPIEVIDAPKAKKRTKKATALPKPKAKPKARTKNFPALTALLSDWNPSDTTASRRLLISEIIFKLEQSGHKCIQACIPAIIVDSKFPIELMHYRDEQGFDEFLTRMLWMLDQYEAAIGILLGVSDEGTASMIAEACDIILSEKNCVVILL
jgi:hypothetical protein